MNWTSSIGLVSDIIGVLLLFKYGLPSKVEESSGSILIGEPHTDTKTRLAKNKKIIFWANVGLTSVLIGFVLQLIGTNITN